MPICNNCKSNLICKTRIGLIITACGHFNPLITNNENKQSKESLHTYKEKNNKITINKSKSFLRNHISDIQTKKIHERQFIPKKLERQKRRENVIITARQILHNADHQILSYQAKNREEREIERNKSRIFHNIEIGKGGPDIAGMKNHNF